MQEKDDALVQVLRDHEGLAVVYASTRRNVERIARTLERRAASPPPRITPGSTTRTGTRCRTRS